MNNEIEMVWVDFVGGPLDGQSRRLERGRTHLNVPYLNNDIEKLNFGAADDEYQPIAKIANYKIERYYLRNSSGSFREWFKGVLI